MEVEGTCTFQFQFQLDCTSLSWLVLCNRKPVNIMEERSLISAFVAEYSNIVHISSKSTLLSMA